MPSRSRSSSQAAPPVARSRRHAPHVSSLLAVLAVLLVLAGAASRPAAAVEDMLTPRALGVGEALRGDATGALGPLLNPSGMALLKSYTIEAIYGFDVRSLGHDVHLSIVDSSTSKLAAGIYYSYVHANPKFHLVPDGATEITRTGSETGLVLAVALGDYLTFGVNMKYLRFTTEAVNPAYDAKNPTAQPQNLVIDSTTSTASANGFTLDAGLTVRLGDKFNIGAVGYNLIPLRSRDAPMAMGIGLALHATPALTMAFDTVIDFDKYYQVVNADTGETARKTTVRLGGGLEWLAGDKVPIRLGAVWDSGRPGTFLTMGLGYLSTNFGIDLSYRQQISAGVESKLLLGLRVFLQ